jgi:hypothetical protein
MLFPMATSQAASKESIVFFRCGPCAHTASDVVDAASFRGELESHWNEVLRLAACEEAGTENDLELDGTALDAASESFRYRHDLITAEETEQWLERRGLSLSDFSEYFTRHDWGNTLRGKVTARKMPYHSAPVELQELLFTELILSGELDQMAARLGRRIAAIEAAGEQELDAELFAAEHRKFLERAGLTPETLGEWLENMGREASWLEQMARGEVLYDRRCHAVLTAGERQRELADLRLPLTQFDVEMVELESLDAAREAFLCVRDDGISMEEVAKEGHYPFRRYTRLAEEIPLEDQQRFLSASRGDLLDPIERGDGFQLFRILGKMEPNLDDPVVRGRADERILDRHFAELVSRHLQWCLLTAPTG